MALLMTVALLASVSWARGQFVELNPPPSFIDGDPPNVDGINDGHRQARGYVAGRTA